MVWARSYSRGSSDLRGMAMDCSCLLRDTWTELGSSSTRTRPSWACRSQDYTTASRRTLQGSSTPSDRSLPRCRCSGPGSPYSSSPPRTLCRRTARRRSGSKPEDKSWDSCSPRDIRDQLGTDTRMASRSTDLQDSRSPRCMDTRTRWRDLGRDSRILAYTPGTSCWPALSSTA